MPMLFLPLIIVVVVNCTVVVTFLSSQARIYYS